MNILGLQLLICRPPGENDYSSDSVIEINNESVNNIEASFNLVISLFHYRFKISVMTHVE